MSRDCSQVPVNAADSASAPRAATAPHVVLPSVAIVEQTIAKARRTVSLALLGAGLIVCAVLAERTWLLGEATHIATQLAAAQQAAGLILLNDERLTMSAHLAAATGDATWVKRYDQYIPEIDAAIAQGNALAPPDVADRFNQETRAANDRLVALERYSLEAASAGNIPSAQATLASAAYAENKQVLNAGTERFAQDMVGAVNDRLTALHTQANFVMMIVAALSLAAAALISRHLGSSLARSRGYFLDAQRVAANDMLTGVANRVSMRDALAGELARSAATGQPLALLMIDLDRFKPINDRLGHAVGDMVLKEAADRMGKSLRQGELLARWGGDEFAVLIPACSDLNVAVAIAERLVRAVSAPMVVGGHAVDVGATVGVARFPDDAKLDAELLHNADLALYAAKAERRGSVRCYDPRMVAAPSDQALQAQLLGKAIASGQIVPFYQPIVDLGDRKARSLEILSRWQHPERGLVPPAEFIPLAESSGQIGALTLAVLRQACIDARGFDPALRLSINIVAAQMEDASLVPLLLAVMLDTGFDPRRLEIELTEHALVRNIDAARSVIAALKAAGMTIALDDFGTGYSSLAYLSDLPFDKLKIDRSFVVTLRERSESAKVVAAIIGLSRSLGAQVIAEGVETEGDAEALQRLGCEQAQGYLFARPMPAAAVAQDTWRMSAVPNVA